MPMAFSLTITPSLCSPIPTPSCWVFQLLVIRQVSEWLTCSAARLMGRPMCVQLWEGRQAPVERKRWQSHRPATHPLHTQLSHGFGWKEGRKEGIKMTDFPSTTVHPNSSHQKYHHYWYIFNCTVRQSRLLPTRGKETCSAFISQGCCYPYLYQAKYSVKKCTEVYFILLVFSSMLYLMLPSFFK